MKKTIPRQYKFIIRLGKALHKYGVQSYKIERYLKQVCEIKNIKGTFIDNPTYVNYVFYEEDNTTYNYMKILKPGEINLGGLSHIVEITNKVLDNNLDFSDASDQIDQIDSNTKINRFISFFAFLISGPSFCIILNTNWTTVWATAIAEIFIWLLYIYSDRSDYLSSVLECAVAFFSTLILGVMSCYIPGINISLGILASIIIFIPGLSITTALEEITSNNLSSGTAKFAGAMVSLFKQFFGVILGIMVLKLFLPIQEIAVVDNIPKWLDPIGITLLAGSLIPIFKVRTRDILLCLIIGFISYYTTILLEPAGILLSIFTGTIVIMMVSKYFSKWHHSPKIVFKILGIVMLVPGSKAFISLSSLFGTSSPDTPSNMGLQVVYIFMGIIGGILLSGSLRANRDEIK
ncbi:MAG: threonine/serine exporter family protein [Bacteroidales bacterium]